MIFICFHLPLDFPSGLFNSVFQTKLCVHFCFLPCLPHAPCHSFWFDHPIIFVQNFKPCSSSRCPYVQFPNTVSVLNSHTFVTVILRSNTLSLWCQTKHLSGSEKRKPSVVHTRPASGFTNGLKYVLRSGTGSHSARVDTAEPGRYGVAVREFGNKRG
jgi:hypothetical protein